jgi:hypothetical protein
MEHQPPRLLGNPHSGATGLARRREPIEPGADGHGAKRSQWSLVPTGDRGNESGSSGPGAKTKPMVNCDGAPPGGSRRRNEANFPGVAPCNRPVGRIADRSEVAVGAAPHQVDAPQRAGVHGRPGVKATRLTRLVPGPRDAPRWRAASGRTASPAPSRTPHPRPDVRGSRAGSDRRGPREWRSDDRMLCLSYHDFNCPYGKIKSWPATVHPPASRSRLTSP